MMSLAASALSVASPMTYGAAKFSPQWRPTFWTPHGILLPDGTASVAVHPGTMPVDCAAALNLKM